MMPMTVSDPERRVLNLLRERPMEGYALRSRTGLSSAELKKAVEGLRERSLVVVKGGLTDDGRGDAVVWIPPNAQGKVAMLLGSESA